MSAIITVSGLTVTVGGVPYSSQQLTAGIDREAALETAGGIISMDVVSVASSAEDLDYGDIDTTKEHFVRLQNLGTNPDTDPYITVYQYSDVSTYQVVGVIRPGESYGPVRKGAMTAGYPKLKVKSSSGTARMHKMVSDAGDPTA